jgi:hypothetical protein
VVKDYSEDVPLILRSTALIAVSTGRGKGIRLCFGEFASILIFVIGLFVDYALLLELQTVMYSATPWKSSRHRHNTIEIITTSPHHH